MVSASDSCEFQGANGNLMSQIFTVRDLEVGAAENVLISILAVAGFCSLLSEIFRSEIPEKCFQTCLFILILILIV